MKIFKYLWIGLGVLRDPDLTLAEKLVLAFVNMICHSDKDPDYIWCHLDDNAIGRSMGLDRSVIGKRIRSLVDKGYLHRSYKPSGERSLTVAEKVTRDIGRNTIRIPRTLMQCKKLSDFEKLMFAYVARFEGHGFFFQKNNTIAVAVGVDVPKVRRVLRTLEKKGLIRIHEGQKRVIHITALGKQLLTGKAETDSDAVYDGGQKQTTIGQAGDESGQLDAVRGQYGLPSGQDNDAGIDQMLTEQALTPPIQTSDRPKIDRDRPKKIALLRKASSFSPSEQQKVTVSPPSELLNRLYTTLGRIHPITLSMANPFIRPRESITENYVKGVARQIKRIFLYEMRHSTSITHSKYDSDFIAAARDVIQYGAAPGDWVAAQLVTGSPDTLYGTEAKRRWQGYLEYKLRTEKEDLAQNINRVIQEVTQQPGKPLKHILDNNKDYSDAFRWFIAKLAGDEQLAEKYEKSAAGEFFTRPVMLRIYKLLFPDLIPPPMPNDEYN